MAKLTPQVVRELRIWGYTQRQWAQTTGAISPQGRWVGDACGCSDDRCIGYHHGENEPCGCLPSLLRWYLEHPPE